MPRVVACLIAAIVLAACVTSAGRPPAPVARTISVPATNASLLIEEGTQVMALARIFAYETIDLREPAEAILDLGARQATMAMRPQYLLPVGEDGRYDYYRASVEFDYSRPAESRTDLSSAPSGRFRSGGIRISREDWSAIEAWASFGVPRFDRPAASNELYLGGFSGGPEIHATTIEVTQKDSWGKELIYDGPNPDGSLSFTYLEHRGMAHDPVTQRKIRFDPAEETTLRHEGAEVEVEGRLGKQISVTVLSQFAESMPQPAVRRRIPIPRRR